MPNESIRVLVVDDEEDLLAYLAKRLKREGFEVSTVTSGDRAVVLSVDQDFDVAVVDLKMPGMDGIECQRRLKEQKPWLQTIVLTGHGSYQAALDSGRENAFCFMQKPAEHAELVSNIRQAAEKKREVQNRMFQEEMSEVTSAGGNPRDILRAVEELRSKYGLG